VSRNKAPIWGLRPHFYYCQTVTGLLMWGALSDERTVLPFKIVARAVFLGSEFRGTRGHISLSQIRDPPTWRVRSPYLYPPRAGWPRYTPRYWVPFRRFLRLAGLRWRYSNQPPHGGTTPVRVRVRVTLRLAFYRQSVRLGADPLETHGQNFIFSQLNTCGHSPYITYSLTRGWVCHLQLLLALASAFILGSESRETRDHILLFQIPDFRFCRLL
jgi:hypothetical protein